MIDLTDIQTMTLTVVQAHTNGAEVTGAEIANFIGLRPRDTGKDGADMRSVINALRKKGYPICANGKGYYYPKTREEIESYMVSLEHRLMSAQEALDGMKTALPIWESDQSVREPTGAELIEI